MKLVFNRGGLGNTELKKHLGFIDKSIVFENLERFIKNATHTVIAVIGQGTYDVIQGYYENETTNETELIYIDMLQAAISVEGYRRYVPSKDVGHTQNGRRMRVDDHEKQAFEWMLDRDNENMERMYYLSLDQLLNTLESLGSWKATSQYQKLNSLFVSKTSDFQEYFNINNSRYTLMQLTPGLRQAERMAIVPRLGKSKTQALKNREEPDEELLSLVKEACVYWALAWAMKGRLTVTLFPEGVLQRFVSDSMTTQGRKPAMMNETAWAAQEFQNDANALLKKIEEHIAPKVVVDTTIDEDTGYGFDEDSNYVTT